MGVTDVPWWEIFDDYLNSSVVGWNSFAGVTFKLIVKYN